MMRAAQVVDQLSLQAENPNHEHLLATARTIKNDSVGNPDVKRAYVQSGAIPALVDIASSNAAPPPLIAEALAALCTLCVRCEQGIAALLKASSALDVIISALHAPPPLTVSYSAARVLKVLVTSPFVPRHTLDIIASRPLAMAQLVALSAHNGPVCATAAATIAAVVRQPEHASIALSAGALQALIPALAPRAHPIRTDAALDALAALAAADPKDTAEEIASNGAPLLVLPLVRSTESANTRLAACRLLARLRRARALDGRQEKSEIINAVIPQLIGLLSSEQRSVRRAAACVLSEMVDADDAMQRRATEEGAVSRLASFFRPDAGSNTNQSLNMPPSRVKFTPENTRGVDVDEATLALPMAEAALDALAALCANLDEARDRVVEEAKLWPFVIKYLGSDEPSVVLAAARCVRSITRSVKILRGDICTNDVTRLFLQLLESANLEIRRCVSAAVCNIVVGFSAEKPMNTFMDNGGFAALARLLHSGDNEIIKNGLCAIKNVLFKADVETKKKVMEEVGYNRLADIASTEESMEMRELAMHIFRNLACFGASHNETDHLDVLLAQMGDRMYEMLEHALIHSNDSEAAAVGVQALYTACNIASGTEKYKTRIMESQIPRLLLSWMDHSNDQARIAALWCTINLAKKELTVEQQNNSTNSLTSSIDRPNTRGVMMTGTRAPPRRSYFRRAGRGVPRSFVGLTAAAPQRQTHPAPSLPSERENENENMVLDSNDDGIAHVDDVVAIDEEEALELPAANNSSETPMDIADANKEGEVDGKASKGGADGDDAPVAMEEDDDKDKKEENNEATKGYTWRMGKLREMKFEEKLKTLVNDTHLEVRGRARAALEQFGVAHAHPASDARVALNYSPRSLLTRMNPPAVSGGDHRGYLPTAVASPVSALRIDGIVANNVVVSTAAPSEDSSGSFSEENR